MITTKKLLLLSLFLFSVVFNSFGQTPSRIVGYYAYYENANRIQWDKITDLNYAFGRPENNGSITLQGTALQGIVTTAAANNVDVYIALGGANQSYGFNEIVKTQAGMDAFATSINNMINQYGLAGVDLDWEFPEAHQAAGMLQMIKTIRAKIGNNKKISIAATPLSFNAAGTPSEIEPYVDYFNIMSYDDSDAANHASMEFAKAGIEYWSNKVSGKGIPREKLVLGVPFYGKGEWGDIFYRDIPDAYADVDTYGTYGFNGRVTIREKADLTLEEGLNGIMIWEICQDKLDQYSLLTVINDVYDNKERCKLPDLGDSQTLCGVPSVGLDAGITGNYGFSWTKDNGTFNGTSNTNTVTEQGEYCVEVTDNSGACTVKESCLLVRDVSDIQVENGSVCQQGTVDLSVLSAGDYEWFNDKTGGSSFHTGSNYTTGSITSDQTFYVEKQQISGFVGESNYTNYGWFNDYTVAASKDHYLQFDAEQDIIITSCTAYFGLVENEVTFTVYASDKTTIIDEQTFPILEIDEDNNGQVDFVLDLHVPKGDDYYLSLRKSTNTRIYIDNQQPGAGITYSYPYVLNGLFEGKAHIAPHGSDVYAYIGMYNIGVSSEASCERVPVTATVNSNCILPTMTIIKPTANQIYNLENVDLEVDVNDADGTVVKVVANIIRKSNLQTLETIVLTGNNNSFTGTWVPTDVGEYYVEFEATDDDQNKKKEQVSIVVATIIGTDELNLEALSVYPNPVENFLNVKTEGKIQSIKVLDINGKVVFQTISSSSNVSHLSSGVYCVKVNTENGNYMTKFLKK